MSFIGINLAIKIREMTSLRNIDCHFLNYNALSYLQYHLI